MTSALRYVVGLATLECLFILQCFGQEETPGFVIPIKVGPSLVIALLMV